jgi:hypothetical protein
VNSAYEIGLRPEFAILCGLHPDKKVSEEEREVWYNEPPRYHVEELVIKYSCVLTELWEQKATAELPKSYKMADQQIEVSALQLSKGGTDG